MRTSVTSAFLFLVACGPRAALPGTPPTASGASVGSSASASPGSPSGPTGAAKPGVRTALVGELVTEGPVAKRVSTSPADLVVFYGGEHKGSLETCGCPKRPRGSFARFATYVNASRAANPGVPNVVVNAGYWLQDAMGFDGALRPDLTLANEWMVDGSRALGWDALNVGYPDVAGLATLPADDGVPLPLVSANVTGPGVNRWVIVERDGLRVGITGITGVGQLLSDTPGYTIAPPASAGDTLAALGKEVDVVVLLAYQATAVAQDLAARHPEIDIVVDAAMYRDFAEGTYVGQAAWTTSSFQTMRLGELRLDLADGHVLGGRSRHVDLDPEVPDEPHLAALAKKARAELDAAQQALYGAP